jgi:1-acyl-sn-glycerol-3-phosphate acyltransferase
MRTLDILTEINLDDLVSSFGWDERTLAAATLRWLFRSPAKKFARWMLEFDTLVLDSSLPISSRQTLNHFAKDLQVIGKEYVPQNGPVLFLSNHPGMVDTLALFASINRDDLRIIALDRPFLQSLPNIAHHLLFVSENPLERVRVIKRTTAHLRQGGAVLTFPAGKIEPDLQVYPGALDSLENWIDSSGVFLRLAPDTVIVPVLVSGVLWERAVKCLIIKFKSTREDREKFGAALQLLAHIIFNVRPLKIKVRFAKPINIMEIGTTDISSIHKLIISRMYDLIKSESEK